MLISNFLAKQKQNNKPLTAEEINPLIYKAQAGDMDARNLIIERNLGLVLKNSSKWFPATMKMHRIEMDDLIQEATIGMFRAIELFDPKKGFAFSTYATWWILQALGRYVDNQKGLIRVPVHASSIQKQFQRIQMEYEGKDEDFYINLLAFENDRSPQSIKNALHFQGDPVVSMDLTYEDGEEPVYQIESLTWEIDTSKIDADYIKKMAKFLPERDMRILMLRMDNWNLEAIAEMTGITRERVRQIQNSALIKLRAMVNRVTNDARIVTQEGTKWKHQDSYR